MAFLDREFSADSLPASSGGDFGPIPAGWYVCRIVKAELTDTKSGTGQYIKLRLDVVGPTHQGRVLWSNINIKNQSAKAEEIGLSQLGDIMRALGIPKVKDTDQLIGGELAVNVAVKDDPQYGPGNDVKGYKSSGSNAEPTYTPAPAANGGSPGAVKNTPPWMKK